jgi:hypothetical protein
MPSDAKSIETILNISTSDLIFFVDETGHEEYRDSNHPVFGLGGCAMMEPFYRTVFVPAWEQMRRDSFSNSALHASGLHCTEGQRHALARIFKQSFSRFAAISKSTTLNSSSLIPYALVGHSLMRRAAEVAQWYPFTKWIFIFESSQRLDPYADLLFPMQTVQEKSGDEISNVPVEWYRMTKQDKEPGLELADFVMNTAGRHVRNKMVKGKSFSPGNDFAAMFLTIDRRLVSWIEIDSAFTTPTTS